MKKLNFELLKDMYRIHSMSGREQKLSRFVKAYIGSHIKGASVTVDGNGNMLVVKGESDTYPCLCAHLDQVQNTHPDDFMCIDAGDDIIGYSPNKHRSCGLGADDKNGLFVALECLSEYDVLKCAFFVGEEAGGVGSRRVDMSFFGDCRFCLQIDRRGNSDFVTFIGGKICSDVFISDIGLERYGYTESYGAFTDIQNLISRGVGISCANMSCGYYNPHTDMEVSSKTDIEKCHRLVCHIIETCTRTYPMDHRLNTVCRGRFRSIGPFLF